MAYKDPEREKAYRKTYCEQHKEERKVACAIWYHKHAEEQQAKYHQYYLQHQEEMKANQREYNRLNKGKRLLYYRNHVEEIRTKARIYYYSHRQENLERLKIWAQSHPQLVRAYSSKRRAIKRATFVELIDYEAIKTRDKMICGICKKKVKEKELSFDHMLPLSRGGSHTQDNLQVSHRHCNHKKGPGFLPTQLRLSMGAIK